MQQGSPKLGESLGLNRHLGLSEDADALADPVDDDELVAVARHVVVMPSRLMTPSKAEGAPADTKLCIPLLPCPPSTTRRCCKSFTLSWCLPAAAGADRSS